jgi:hypothetical protein
MIVAAGDRMALNNEVCSSCTRCSPQNCERCASQILQEAGCDENGRPREKQGFSFRGAAQSKFERERVVGQGDVARGSEVHRVNFVLNNYPA